MSYLPSRTASYSDETVALYEGDAIELVDDLSPGVVDLVVTDPPYSSGARRDSERSVRGSMLRGVEDGDWFASDAMTTRGFSYFMRSLFLRLRVKLIPGAHLYVFSDWRQEANTIDVLESSGYRVNRSLVWAKTHFGMGSYWRNQDERIVFASNGQPTPMLRRDRGTVLTAANVSPQKRVHPTEKPADLLERIVDAAPGGVVLDPFCGSGATLLAARKCGRKSIGFEINPSHVDTAAKRLSQEVLPLGAA